MAPLRQAEARVDATAPIPTADVMAKENARDALGSINWALRVLNRKDLVVVARKFFQLSGTEPSISLDAQSDKHVRDLLRRCAQTLYDKDPQKLLDLDKYLLAFGRASLQKSPR